MSARSRHPAIRNGVQGLSPGKSRMSLHISGIVSPRSLVSASSNCPSTTSAKRRRFLDDSDAALCEMRELRESTETYLIDIQTSMARLDAMRWSVCLLLCLAVCCSVLQCVAVCCNVLQCVALCCTVLHCVAACCSVLQCVALCCRVLLRGAVWRSVAQCGAVWCSVVQSGAE